MGMVQDARELELAVQPRLLGGRAMRFVEDLQRHRRGVVGPEPGVAGSVDGGVPPAPDFVIDQVAAEVDAGFAHEPQVMGPERASAAEAGKAP